MNPNTARFIWTDSTGEGRNVFAHFKRRFTLDAVPNHAPIQLFADANYRLRVNGHVAFYGPSRFTPKHPAVDEVDLSPWLVKGENQILVEAWAPGSKQFQAMPSRGGFIAIGYIDGIDLSTPGEWLAATPTAWDRNTERFSFAQGPLEQIDLRACGDENWREPVLLADQSHWGPLEPRELPVPSLTMLNPERVVVTGQTRCTPLVLGFRVDRPAVGWWQRLPVMTHIYSPARVTTTIHLFNGPWSLNGQRLDIPHTGPRRHPRRIPIQVTLNTGWNLLYGEPRLNEDFATYLVGIDRTDGLRVACFGDAGGTNAFATLDPIDEQLHPEQLGQSPATASEMASFPDAWQTRESMPNTWSPARRMSWDETIAPVAHEPHARRDIRLSPGEQDATVVYDFGREYLGHLIVELTTSAEVTLDVAYDERLNDDGSLGLFWREQNNNTAERYILPSGRHTIESFHERGGRYTQLTFRGEAEVTVHSIAIRRTVGDYPIKASFECSDSILNWGWHTGVETTRCSMSDGWIDPWRERGLYIGDALVEADATRAFTDDHRLARWAIRLWSRTQKDDGQMLDVTPGWKTAPLVDYTLIWVLLLHDHVASNGDLDLAREVYNSIPRIFASPLYERAPSGMWIPKDKAFIDWGVVPEQRTGENGPLNAFRVAALDASARLAGALGKVEDAATYAAEAKQVRDAFQSLWDESAGRYASGREPYGLSTAPAIHCNILALLYDIVPPQRCESVLAFVVEDLRTNISRRTAKVAIYFMYYALLALYKHNRAAEAEQLMRTHWGFQKDAGALTLVEELDRLRDGVGSYCHGWACGNVVMCRQHLLGVSWDFADPMHIRIEPHADSIEWAEGSVPHPRGSVRVRWRVQGETLFIEHAGPAGVAVTVAPRGRLATLWKVVQSNGGM